MFVYVIDKHGKPLMPTTPPRARSLLKAGKAKVVRRDPFTINLIYGSSGYKQEVVSGMDTGSKTVGCAAIANGKVLYQAEVTVRSDVSRKMQQRAMYRRSRRSRKTRYRPGRRDNRAAMKMKGRLAPSITSKIESHLRERKFTESILPVSQWKVELAAFDIHRIINPDVSGARYQDGNQKGFYNVKSYVLNRDSYICQSGRQLKHDDKLHVHHIQFRSQGGSDAPSNLITLCERCHADLHSGEFSLKARRPKTKHPTQVGIIKSAILRSGWEFKPTYGYETKFKREQYLRWEKSHVADAVSIACDDGETADPLDVVWRKRHVPKGDYQQTSGKRSEQSIPTGKLFGLRKFDLISVPKATGFIKGKRITGRFVLMNIDGKIIADTSIKKNATRISARSTTMTERRAFFVSART